MRATIACDTDWACHFNKDVLIRTVNVTLSTGVNCVLFHVRALCRCNNMEPFYKENDVNLDVPIFFFNKPAFFQSSLT